MGHLTYKLLNVDIHHLEVESYRLFRDMLKKLESISMIDESSLLLCSSDSLLVISLLDFLILLGDDELDVAVGREVGSNSTMSSVSSCFSLNGSLNSEVSDWALLNIETLCFSVWLKVLEELHDVFDWLFRESTLGDTVELGLSCSADVAVNLL